MAVNNGVAAELIAVRERCCRLRPEFALGRLEEAFAFLEDRGLLTVMPCCALPSLFGACHEEPHTPGAGGFGSWPRTKWVWRGELAGDVRVVPTKLHRGNGLLASRRVAALLDPLVRVELASSERGELGDDAHRLVTHLGDAGPSATTDVRAELGWSAATLRRARSRLEPRGILITRPLVDEAEGGRRQDGLLARWDQVVDRAPRHADPLGEVILALVRAGVVMPRPDLGRCLPWVIGTEKIDALIESGRLSFLPGGLLAAGYGRG